MIEYIIIFNAYTEIKPTEVISTLANVLGYCGLYPEDDVGRRRLTTEKEIPRDWVNALRAGGVSIRRDDSNSR